MRNKLKKNDAPKIEFLEKKPDEGEEKTS